MLLPQCYSTHVFLIFESLNQIFECVNTIVHEVSGGGRDNFTKCLDFNLADQNNVGFIFVHYS